MRESESLFFPIRGLRYHVRHWPAPGARKIVLLHGWMDVSASFQFMVDALRGTWDVYAPDWRGYGLTEWEKADSYWFPDYIADLEFLLDRITDEPILLVGHSLGGLVTLRWAAAGVPDIVRGAALSNPLIDIVDDVPWWKRRMFESLARMAPTAPLPRRSVVENLTQDPERIAAWRADRLRHARITPRAMLGIDRAMEAARGAPLEVSLPLLLLLEALRRRLSVRPVAVTLYSTASDTHSPASFL